MPLNIFHPNLLRVSKLANEQVLRVAKSLTSLFSETASRQRTFYYRTVLLWNNLEPFLKSSQTVKLFKHSLRSQLLENFVNTS